MNKNTSHIKWHPIKDAPRKMYKEYLHDDKNKISIALSEKTQEKLLIIKFDWVLSYRDIDESDFLKTGSENLSLGKWDNWTFYKIENSRYLQWFQEESCNMHKFQKITHYQIVTPNDVIDILSIVVPEAVWR